MLQVELVDRDGDTVTLDDDVDARPQPAPAGRRPRAPGRPSCPRARAWARPRSASLSSAGRGDDRLRARAPPGGPRDGRRARRARRPAGPGAAAQLQRRDARRARHAGGRPRAAHRHRRRHRAGHARRHRRRPRGGRRPRALGRRLRRPARPRQARARTPSASTRSSGASRCAPDARPGSAPAATTLVFGLPGNPVSAMVTFMLFARPALGALQGAAARARADRLPTSTRPSRATPIATSACA